VELKLSCGGVVEICTEFEHTYHRIEPVGRRNLIRPVGRMVSSRATPKMTDEKEIAELKKY